MKVLVELSPADTRFCSPIQVCRRFEFFIFKRGFVPLECQDDPRVVQLNAGGLSRDSELKVRIHEDSGSVFIEDHTRTADVRVERGGIIFEGASLRGKGISLRHGDRVFIGNAVFRVVSFR